MEKATTENTQFQWLDWSLFIAFESGANCTFALRATDLWIAFYQKEAKSVSNIFFLWFNGYDAIDRQSILQRTMKNWVKTNNLQSKYNHNNNKMCDFIVNLIKKMKMFQAFFGFSSRFS